MKSLEELQAIRDRMQDNVILRKGQAGTRVVVSMGTCGIAAGARSVLNALVDEVAEKGLMKQVTVTQNGRVDSCGQEPVVEVFGTDGEHVTYVKVTPAMAKEIVEKHLIGGRPVAEYTADAARK